MYDADFFTVQIKPIFHIIEIKAHTDPRAMIPNPREVSFGINAGINATAYTAAFALVRLVIKPNLNDPHVVDCTALSRSNFPNSFRRDRKVCAEMKVKKTTPDHLRIKYAVSDSVKIADSPIALEKLQINIPAQLPMEERKAAFGPPIMDWRKTMATPWPGIITNKVVARINEGRFSKSVTTRPYVALALIPQRLND